MRSTVVGGTARTDRGLLEVRTSKMMPAVRSGGSVADHGIVLEVVLCAIGRVLNKRGGATCSWDTTIVEQRKRSFAGVTRDTISVEISGIDPMIAVQSRGTPRLLLRSTRLTQRSRPAQAGLYQRSRGGVPQLTSRRVARRPAGSCETQSDPRS